MFCSSRSTTGAADRDTFADAYATLFERTLVMRQVHNRADAARIAQPLIASLIDAHIPAG